MNTTEIIVDSSKIIAIADAVRSQTGSEEEMSLSEISDEIYSLNNTPKEAVLYIEQSLTDEQKAQARENIGITEISSKLKALTINDTAYDGSEAVNFTNTINGMIDEKSKDFETKPFKPSVKDYDAVGDGTKDDTEAFKNALKNNRLVYVPEGTYILSDTLVVRPNCELELAQSAVLRFTTTDESYNCITLLRLASLKGNHATIQVPYEFSASVINASTEDDLADVPDKNGDGDKVNENTTAVPPFTRWDPQWRMSRYVTDINICKTMDNDGPYAGFHYSKTGDTAGTAIKMICNESDDPINYMWGVLMSGVRIAGAFEFGIYIDNDYATTKDKAWNHDMRIEAVMDACKTAVYAHNCNIAHLDITFQPREAADGTAYTEKGIELHDCRWIDLSRAFIWDWDDIKTKRNASKENRPIAMYGNCRGLVLSIPYYYEGESNLGNYVFSENDDNLETMVLFQKDSSKYFKPIDGKPYFLTETAEKELVTQEWIESLFGTASRATFDNKLPIASDKGENTIYNGIGYKTGLSMSGNLVENADGTFDPQIRDSENERLGLLTGFIPVEKGQTIYFESLLWELKEQERYYERIFFFDKDKKPIVVNGYAAFDTADKLLSGKLGYISSYEKTDGIGVHSLTVADKASLNNLGYVRINFYMGNLGEATPIITVNQPIKYEQIGVLSDGIKVKAENVEGLIEYSNATTSQAGLMSSEDKIKLDNINIAYGVCSTAAATAKKEITLSGNEKWELKEGSFIAIKFNNSNEASNVTLNVNNTGDYPIWYNASEYTSNSTSYTGYAGRVTTYMFDGTHYVWISNSYDSNTTYTNVKLGHGYATCSTAASTTAKTATLSSYTLTTGGIVAVRFSNSVPKNATLNINSKGAKAIYYKNAPITDGVIKAGDVATFIYSTYYRLLSIDRWQDDISTVQEEVDTIKASYKPSVKSYGAIGVSQEEISKLSEDEINELATTNNLAFQAALANNRLVYVPEGIYYLSEQLYVRPNCELELSQATHLKFTQTSDTCTCIELRSSATLRGNHAVIQVPYDFTGNVISADTQYDEGSRDTPPFTHYDPMWKRARYIYDVCIVKPNSAGLHCSIDGKCSGTGIYLSAKGKHLTEGDINFIWGAMLQGVRIAGAFTYGIHVENIDDPDNPEDPNDDPTNPYDDGKYEDDAWNHDMRIEAVIQGCETGVSLFNCNLAHLSVTIQPSTADGSDAYRYTKYAKWGVRLEDCKGIDMTSSFVWDWGKGNTLFSEENKEYTHIAMYGNCTGLVLGDYLYHANSTDIRKQIYSDRTSNLEKMTVLQEPITRWFKPIDNLPYFSDGYEEKRLVLKEEFDTYFTTDTVPTYDENALLTAIDTDGQRYNGVGYKKGGNLTPSATISTDDTYGIYTHTGFIKCKSGDVIYIKGIDLATNDTNCRIAKYDSNFNFLDSNIAMENIISSAAFYHYTTVYDEEKDVYEVTLVGAPKTEYIRMSFYSRTLSDNAVITVNEEIGYETFGFIADSIKVKAENVIGLPSGAGVTLTSPNGTLYKIIVNDDGTLTTEQT